MAHRIVRCACHVTKPLDSNRWSFCLLGHRTVRWCTGQALFSVRCAIRLYSDSARIVAHLMPSVDDRWHEVAIAPLAHWTLSGATPDSPVNYSRAASRIPEGEQFGVRVPGAPDTVWWHTGQSGAPD
jgi:hypothetical protein